MAIKRLLFSFLVYLVRMYCDNFSDGHDGSAMSCCKVDHWWHRWTLMTARLGLCQNKSQHCVVERINAMWYHTVVCASWRRMIRDLTCVFDTVKMRNLNFKIIMWNSDYLWLHFKGYWVDLIALEGLKCPSVRPQKSFSDFSEIWYVDRGRWLMHDGMLYDSIQGQGHDYLKATQGESTVSPPTGLIFLSILIERQWLYHVTLGVKFFGSCMWCVA